MPTADLKKLCPATKDKPGCGTESHFKQIAGDMTTWDHDDRFKHKRPRVVKARYEDEEFLYEWEYDEDGMFCAQII